MTTPTSRLLGLLALLQTGREWPGPLLARRLGISHRTVRRDVERLRALGYTVRATMGPDGGYRLEAGADLPPLLFDEEQVVALAVALRTATLSGAGIEEAALRALTTVRQLMPSRLRHRADALEFTTLARPRSGRPGSPGSGGSGGSSGSGGTVATEVLIALSGAVRARETLRFDYADPAATPAEGRDPSPPRRAEPHHLTTAGGRWYLLAWDLDADDWRIFRADRITLRVPNGRRFAPRPIPGGDARAFVAARFRGSAPDEPWPCTGTVVLHRPAREVLPYAGSGTVEPLDSDRCRYTAGSWSWVALAATLTLFDTDVDVVGPPALRDAFATIARRTATSAAAG